jgi:hypothetical protein
VTVALAAIIDGYLDLRGQMDPVVGTEAGRRDLDGRFAAFDRDSVRGVAAAVRSYAGNLEEAEADTLDDEIDRTAALHAARHDLLVLERERPFARNAAFHLRHALDGISALASRLEEDPAQRTVSLLERVRGVPDFLSCAQAAVTDPVPLFLDEARTLVGAALTLLRDELDALPLDRTAIEASDWDAARAAAVDAVLEFGDWLSVTGEGARGTFAIGRDLFDLTLHTAHMIRESAAELERFGERLRRESLEVLDAVTHEIVPGADWRALGERMTRRGAEHRAAVAACVVSLDAAVGAQARPVRRALGTRSVWDGWALYCEGLLVEEGVLASPEHRYLTVLERLRRALLVSVDVGLHTRGLAPDDAVRLLVEAMPIDAGEATALVLRACGSPTTMLGGAVGWRDIVLLRDDARAARGVGWSAARFHRDLLGYGALPTALARWGMGLS